MLNGREGIGVVMRRNLKRAQVETNNGVLAAATDQRVNGIGRFLSFIVGLLLFMIGVILFAIAFYSFIVNFSWLAENTGLILATIIAIISILLSGAYCFWCVRFGSAMLSTTQEESFLIAYGRWLLYKKRKKKEWESMEVRWKNVTSVTIENHLSSIKPSGSGGTNILNLYVSYENRRRTSSIKMINSDDLTNLSEFVQVAQLKQIPIRLFTFDARGGGASDHYPSDIGELFLDHAETIFFKEDDHLKYYRVTTQVGSVVNALDYDYEKLIKGERVRLSEEEEQQTHKKKVEIEEGKTAFVPKIEKDWPPKLSTSEADPIQVQAGQELKPAGFWIRLVASGIDWLGYIFFLFIVFFILEIFPFLQRFTSNDPSDGSVEAVIALIVYIAVFIIIFTGSSIKGSPGKKICRIQVVNPDMTRIGFVKSNIRFLAYFVSCLPFFIGFIAAGWNANRRGLHDMLCNTRVVYRNRLKQ